MMWEIYDALISATDDSIRIKDFAAGTYWTAVLTEDGVLGLAPSIRERYQRFPFDIEPVTGMPICDMAPGLKSWNYIEASIALAAVNAFFNRPDRMPDKAEIYPGGRRSRNVFTKFCESHTKDRRTLFSEPMYERDELRNIPGMIDILRRDEDRTYRDYLYTAYRELLPSCDQLTVSGKSFVSKLAGPMLRYAAELEKKTLLWGMDIPLCPSLMDRGIDHITGFIADDVEECFRLVKRGAVRDDILRFGHFVSIEKQ